MKQLLLIFAKSSQPVNQLQQLFSATEKCQADKFVFYDGFIPVKEIWDNDIYKKYVQLGIDKTEKIMNAFIKGFLKGYDSIVLIDNTAPDLNQYLIESAFYELKLQEVVIGPVKDNSVYLLGMKKFRPELFEEDINGKNIFGEIQKRSISYKELPLLESWASSRVSV
jgi:hypothetical protein